MLRRWLRACVPLLLLMAPAARAQLPPDAPRALTADSLRVVFWPGDEGVARRTLRAALAPLPLPGIPGSVALPAGTIVLAPSPAVFDSLTGGRAPGWSAGVAIPGRQLIILPAFASSRTPLQDPTTALRHELLHLALNRYLPDRIPRWFDEGYATWASGGWDASSGWRIRLALLRGAAPPLDSLTLGWPAGAARAELAYLLSASAVRHLATRGGEQAFAAFLAAWRRQGSYDAALRSVYLMTPEQFEQEWRSVVRRRYGWLLALGQVGIFWVAVTVLFLVLGIRRRAHTRERMRALEEEERMLPPPADPEDWQIEPDLDDEWRRG